MQWQAAVDKAAVRIGALHDDEVAKGMTLVPPPQIAVESIWQMFLAHGWVNENTGKWLATISCVTCIGVGYALPTAQLYFAQKRIARAQAVRVGGNGQAHAVSTP